MPEFRLPRKFKKQIMLNIKKHNFPKEYFTKYSKYYKLVSSGITIKTCLSTSFVEALDWLKFNYPDNIFYQKSLKNVD